ncbi:hypothetical protein [Gracilinema caldarium]|uniref:hypothetical protein n=1 Tax=Gracilinema caldarium TaxID=215591 RepID=UPI0026F369BE|nr:hypothetical protein [Gracilinema caldarium]
MEFLLKSTTKEKGILILHVPLWIRLVLFCIGSVVLFALLLPVQEGSPAGFGVPGLVIIILLFFGIFYEERWVFNPIRKTISFRFGLLFLAKILEIPFDQVDEISVERATKGSMQQTRGDDKESIPQHGIGKLFRPKQYNNLILYLRDSERLVIESVSLRKEEQLIKLKDQIRHVLEQGA